MVVKCNFFFLSTVMVHWELSEHFEMVLFCMNIQLEKYCLFKLNITHMPVQLKENNILLMPFLS